MDNKKELLGLVDKFKDHTESSEQLYGELKNVFDDARQKMKNNFTINGGLRDISEVTKSLSSIRGDAIASTKNAFDSLMKINEFELKEKDRNSGSADSGDVVAIIRQIAASPRNVEVSEDALEARVNREMSSGNIQINTNESAMVKGFKGKVEYAIDPNTNKVVAVDADGQILQGFENRIPDERQIGKVVNDIPYDKKGREIKFLD